MRGCALPNPRLAGAWQAPAEDQLQALARYILEERERRQWHFPRAVFNEIPWEILLLLFASEPAPLSKSTLVDAMLVRPEVVDRWADYLEREGSLRRSRDLQGAPALKLTPEGWSSLELYLLDRLNRADAIDLARNPADGARFPDWAVGLLIVAAAVLSGAVTWSLVAV